MENRRPPRPLRWFAKAVKLSFVLLILLVNGIIIWRVASSGDPEEISRLLVNDKTLAAYAEHGDDLILRYQEQATITRGENNAGYFSVTQAVFIPEAEQVQIVVRYNNSTLRHLQEDYNLSEVPEKEGEWFEVTLVRTTDLTPEDSTDNAEANKLGRDRYYHSEKQRETTALYTYERYLFDGVTVEDLTVGVLVDIYYVNDIDYNKEAYGRLCIYDNESEWLDYDLTRADIKRLKGEE